MFETKIYITTDNISPKAAEKYYGYVLECIVSGETRTREGFGKITGTYHKTVLTALAEALNRFNQPCEICIRTEDEFVLSMLKSNLTVWAENGFLNSKGKPVANQAEWMRIWSLSKKHIIRTKPGRHEYTDWIQREIQKRKEQENV